VALLAAASPCPARAPPYWLPRHPALPARRPALPVHRTASSRTALPCLRVTLPCPRATLLAAAPPCPALPARRPAGRRTALPCPRAALLAAAVPCHLHCPALAVRRSSLAARHASLVLARRPACKLPFCPLWLLSVFSPYIMRAWLTRDAAARLAVCNPLLLAERPNFGQHKTAKALYDIVVARYSSPATAPLGRLVLPYLFPELSAFATVEDLITHLCTSDTRYRAALPPEFLDNNPLLMYITLYFIVTRLPDSLCQVRDHSLALDPTDLTVDLLENHLLAAETSVVAIGAARCWCNPTVCIRLVVRVRACMCTFKPIVTITLVALLALPSLRGVPPPPLPPPTLLLLLLTSLVLRTSGLLLLFVGSATAARARVARVVAVAAGVVVVEAVEAVEVAEVAVGVVAGVGASVAAVVEAVGVVVAAVGVVAKAVVAVRKELFKGEVLAVGRGSSSSVGERPLRPSSFVSGLLGVGRLG
ncbi:unnamed protein product, partial [Closterium sp. NIES-54]